MTYDLQILINAVTAAPQGLARCRPNISAGDETTVVVRQGHWWMRPLLARFVSVARTIAQSLVAYLHPSLPANALHARGQAHRRRLSMQPSGDSIFHFLNQSYSSQDYRADEKGECRCRPPNAHAFPPSWQSTPHPQSSRRQSSPAFSSPHQRDNVQRSRR